MDSDRFVFDPSPVHGHGNMLFLGSTDHVFRGARSMLCIDETAKRARPFFSSADELYNDEYYDEQLPEKKRRLSAEQVHMLEKSFETDNKLEPERKTQLAKKLGLQQRQVAVWFQNRRARWKNKQLEKDYDLLRSSYDSLLTDYDSIAKEHEKLKSEVQHLSEKLQAKEVVTGDQPISNPKSETTVTETDEDGPQVVDSSNSYFPNTNYTAPVDGGVLSEEDDGSDDGQNYFSDVFEQIQDDGEHLGWWVWS